MNCRLISVLCCLALLAEKARPDELVLSTGETLRGCVTRQNEAVVTFVHPVLGTLELQRHQVLEIRHLAAPPAATQPATPVAATAPAAGPAPPEDSALAQAVAPTTCPTPPALEAAVASTRPARLTWWRGWKSRLEAGLTGNAGDNDELVTRTALQTKRNTDRLRTRGELLYYFSQSDGDMTENEFTAAAGNDWLMPSTPWFYFAESRYEYDELSDWNQRLAGDGGAGYAWFDTPQFHLDTRVGAGASKELAGSNDDLKPEGVLGADVCRKIADGRQEIAATTRVFPDLADCGQWRARSSAEWRIKLAQVDGMSLKLGLEHEFESQSDRGQQYDLKYFASLVYEF